METFVFFNGNCFQEFKGLILKDGCMQGCVLFRDAILQFNAVKRCKI